MARPRYRGYKTAGITGPYMRSRQRVSAPRRPPRLFRPGRDRVGGYYGRFSRPNGELKFHDSTPSGTSTAAGAILVSLNLIAQGTTESTRIGRKCIIKSIGFRGRAVLPATATAANMSDVFRLILLIDRQANGANTTVLSVLETENWRSYRNLAESGRYQTLWDKTIVMNARAGIPTTSGETAYPLHYYKKLNLPIEFSGVTGAITEIRSNNLILLLISDSAFATFNMQCRLRFSDGS